MTPVAPPMDLFQPSGTAVPGTAGSGGRTRGGGTSADRAAPGVGLRLAPQAGRAAPADDTDGLDGEDARLRGLRAPAFRPSAERPAVALAQEILRTMRARNLVTGLAIPIMAAIAVGIAVVVAVGANNGPGGITPSQLSAGFPPARIATADFAGVAAQAGRGTKTTLGTVAAFGSQVVAVGAQSGGRIGRALFLHSGDNGHTWQLGTVHGAGGAAPPPQATPVLVTGGPVGWVAIGSGFTFTSPDGQSWLVSPGSLQQPGDQVTGVAAAGTGFVAIGQNAAGGNAAPVLWLSATGASWRRLAGQQLSLPVAAGAKVAGITRVAVSGTVIVMSGAVVTAGGAQAAAAWRSADGGATWTSAMIPAGGNAGDAIAGIAPLGNGFIAVRPAVVNGRTGAVAYTSADGSAWRQSAVITTADGAPLTIGQVTGGPGGAVIQGSAKGFLFAFLSANGTTWLGSDVFGSSAGQQVSGAALTATGQAAMAVSHGTGGGIAAQYPELTLIGSKGGPVRASLAGIPGVPQAQVAVNAIAASGATQVAAGSADGFPALWSSQDGGSTWARGTGATAATLQRPGNQQITAVAHGSAGWVAVGGTSPIAPGHPVVVGSADGGRRWTAEDGAPGLAGNNLVAASVAAGTGGYSIVGWQEAGGHSTGMAWYSAGLTGWERAVVSATGGDTQLTAVTATRGGFVAAGSAGARPAVWVSPNGKVWRQVTLAPPDGAAQAVLQYVAASGASIAAAGTEATAAGARVPFAAISADGGLTWTMSPLPAPVPGQGGDMAVTALAAAGSGFTAIGAFGAPGSQDVAIWSHGPGGGGAWMAVTATGSGLSGPGVQEITALASAGSTLTGAGFTATPAATIPTLWQSPIRG